mmetsp:Transcript_25225/g.25440  ORF Transcript_25225/g.25440 Transcript_25225/m.25440 type:complete len:276 (-) Transcript_25225:7-834(-)
MSYHSKLKILVADRGVLFVTVGWLSFMTENLILSHNRNEIIAHFGSDSYHFAYSALSTISCGAIVYSYFRYCRRHLNILSPNIILSHPSAFLFQVIGFVGVSQLVPKLQNPFMIPGVNDNNSTLQIDGNEDSDPDYDSLPKIMGVTLRCPIDFRASRQQQEDVSGMDRVTRHPALWSLAAVCLGTAVATPFAAEAVTFCFPTVWALMGGAHTDYRHRRGSGGTLTPHRESITSHVPFVALLQGRQDWYKLYNEMKWTNASLGISLATILALKRLR